MNHLCTYVVCDINIQFPHSLAGEFHVNTFFNTTHSFRHVSYIRVMSLMYESCLVYTSHVSYIPVMSLMYESCLVYTSHVSHVRVMSRIYESCLSCTSHVYTLFNMTHSMFHRTARWKTSWSRPFSTKTGRRKSRCNKPCALTARGLC
jgi:hypothetical protein